MNVLLFGATGALGSRVVPALLSNAHNVVVLVRSRPKFLRLMPTEIHDQVQIVQGDATDIPLIKRVLREHGIGGVINAAGAAKMIAHGQDPLSDIVRASVQAIEEFNEATNTYISCWFIGGLLLLDTPNCPDGRLLEHYLPIYREHDVVLPILQSAKKLPYALLCPGRMVSDSKSILTSPEHQARQKAKGYKFSGGIAGAISVPPSWNTTQFSQIGAIGKYIDIFANIWDYQVNTEDVAEYLAANVNGPSHIFKNHRVGIKYII